MNYQMLKYNVVMCYDKILVINWQYLFVHMLVYNKQIFPYFNASRPSVGLVFWE